MTRFQVTASSLGRVARRSPLGSLVRMIAPSPANRYVSYAAMGGIVGSFLGFGEVIARKSLHAGGLAVTLLTMLAPIASISTLWWARLLVGRNQSQLVVVIGSVGAVALASGFFLTHIEHLLLIYLIYFSFVNGLYGQAENRVLQQHVHPTATGKTFGLAQSVAQMSGAAVSAGAGLYMDHMPAGYQQLFLASAIIWLMAVALLASIRTNTGALEDRLHIKRDFILSPLAGMVKVLKERKDFLRFEISFMLYGIAFMMILPVIPLYLVDDLHYSYSKIGVARGTIASVMMIGAVPFFGRVFDRTTPHRMAVWVFIALAGYPLLLLAALPLAGVWRTTVVYAGFAWFGVAMSGLTVLWSLSSIRFSGGEDAGIFQSIHVASTSIRACFAPLLGYAVMALFGKPTALIASSCMWIIAGLSVVYLRKWDMRTGAYRSLWARKG